MGNLPSIRQEDVGSHPALSIPVGMRQVRVDVVMSSGGPLDGSEYAEKHTFRLSRAGGDWLITGTPWPMYDCSKEG